MIKLELKIKINEINVDHAFFLITQKCRKVQRIEKINLIFERKRKFTEGNKINFKPFFKTLNRNNDQVNPVLEIYHFMNTLDQSCPHGDPCVRG